MGSSKSTPGRVFDVVQSGRKAAEKRAEQVRIVVMADPAADAALAAPVRRALTPNTERGLLHVARLDPARPVVVNPEADAVVLLCAGTDGLMAAAAKAWIDLGKPVVLVAATSLDAPEIPDVDEASQPARIVGTDPAVVEKALASWLVRSTDKAFALAANFDCCRKPLAEKLVLATSAENAAVGAIDLVKGADLPVMCVNECKMVLDIAAVYDEGLGARRAPEIAAVLGSGVAMRSLARGLSKLFPGLEWAVRGGVGWVGTFGIGTLIVARHELGEEFDERAAWLWDQVKTVADRAREKAHELGGRVVMVEPGVLYTGFDQESGLEELLDVVDAADGVSVEVVKDRRWFDISDGTANPT
jgi:hypothetical protein